jgi:glutathione S-transferase
MQGMELVAFVTMLMLLQYFIFVLQVGKARVKHEIKAPAITGAPEFERALRVQQNTLEQLIVALPSLWLFSWFINPLVGAAAAVLIMIGRWFYSRDYIKEPSTRGRGFVISQLGQIVLVLGALAGPVLVWLGVL